MSTKEVCEEVEDHNRVKWLVLNDFPDFSYRTAFSYAMLCIIKSVHRLPLCSVFRVVGTVHLDRIYT